MRKRPGGRARRGVTLIETVVAVAIMAFIFAFTGFLIVMSARNAYNLNTQIKSQTSASSAAERCTAMLRDAVYFALWPEDEGTKNARVSRIRFVSPAPGNTVTTQVLCFNPAQKRVEYYASEEDVFFSGMKDDLPVPRGNPTVSWPGVSRALFQWESEYRVTLSFFFEYSGYALKSQGSNNTQLGQFITDVVARNHFMDEGVQNYAQADVATSSPATL